MINKITIQNEETKKMAKKKPETKGLPLWVQIVVAIATAGAPIIIKIVDSAFGNKKDKQ